MNTQENSPYYSVHKEYLSIDSMSFIRFLELLTFSIAINPFSRLLDSDMDSYNKTNWYKKTTSGEKYAIFCKIGRAHV